jgi:pimeloyl-ACP methyl ester carboxylesterase
MTTHSAHYPEPSVRSLPTLVFIPGAWHLPACYGPITLLLSTKHNFRCVPVTLPSTQGDPQATFKDDLDAARVAIAAETSAGRDVVLIAHSYGGMVANSAIKGFTKRPGRSQRPLAAAAAEANPAAPPNATGPPSGSGHVTGLILIASGFTLSGLTFMAHDLATSEEQDYWASQLTPQSLKALFEGAEHSYAGWRDLDLAWYIGTEADKGLPAWVQRFGVGVARGMGPTKVRHVEMIGSSHSPFLSRPGEVVELVVEAVGSFGYAVDTNEAKETAAVAVRSELVVWPAFRLWVPTTWFEFGVPLTLGRVVGWAIAAFLWMRGGW